MKLIWGTDKQSVILIAETFYEVAVAEIFLDGMNYARYYTLKKGRRVVKAKYSIIPEAERLERTQPPLALDTFAYDDNTPENP